MASGKERHSSNVLEKFAVTISLDDGSRTKRDVEGYRVMIPNCPDALLFVHKSPNYADTWCVSEETTGFMICQGASKPAAVGRARRLISSKYDKFLASIKKYAAECINLK